MLTALTQARAVLDQGERFSKLLGRPFSAEAPENAAGWTDLHHAAVMNLPAVAAALIDAGMAVDTRMKEDSTPIGDDVKQMLAALGLGEAFKDWAAEGDTRSIWPPARAALDTVALLLDRGAGHSRREQTSAPPLFTMQRWLTPATRSGCCSTVAPTCTFEERMVRRRCISRRYATPTRQRSCSSNAAPRSDATREDGKTALHRTAPRDARETARLLLDRGADVNARSNGGWTPLHEAARQNARETAELLLDRGADVTLNSDNGASPLYSAAAGNAREIAEALLDGAVHVNVRTNTGLDAAAQCGPPECPRDRRAAPRPRRRRRLELGQRHVAAAQCGIGQRPRDCGGIPRPRRRRQRENQYRLDAAAQCGPPECPRDRRAAPRARRRGQRGE